jgi:hypothetical protein
VCAKQPCQLDTLYNTPQATKRGVTGHTGLSATKKPSSRTSAESSMLKRRGLLGTRSPRTHIEAAFCALNAHTEADHRLQRSHQVAHSPSPQCSNAEVYSVRDHRTRTMRQLSGTQCAHRSGPRLLRSRRVATSRDLNAQTQRSTRYAITAHAQ